MPDPAHVRTIHILGADWTRDCGSVDWSTKQRFKDNYAAAGLMPDPNFGFGRNARPNLIEVSCTLASAGSPLIHPCKPS